MKSQPPFYLKLFAFLAITAGLSVLALSVLKTNFDDVNASFGLLALAAVYLGAHVGLKIPGKNEHIPLLYLFVFIALLFFDSSVVVLMTLLAASYAALRRDKDPLLILFNSITPVIPVFLICEALHFYFGSSATIASSYNLLISLCAICLIQSTWHSIVSSVNGAFRANKSSRQFSIVGYVQTCLTYFALAATAGFVVKLATAFNLPTLYVIAAFCAASFLIYLFAIFRGSRVAKPEVEAVEAIEAVEVAEAQVSHFNPRVVQEREDVFRDAFDHASIAAALINTKGKCLQVNRSLCELLNQPVAALQSCSLQKFVHPDDASKFQVSFAQLLKGETSTCQIEQRFTHQDGHEVWATCALSSVRDEDAEVKYLVVQIQDITKRKEEEEALLRNAFHDALTGLPNRVLFIDHLKLAINRTQRHEGQIYTVLFIDLDRFKIINDSLGHLVGDQLLISIARRLETYLRPGDTIARVGGDEFTILLEDLQDESEAISIAHRIQKELSAPFIFEGREVFTTVSIGVAPSSPGYQNPADILRDADTAMYRAKLMGKNRYEIFDRAMHEVAIDLLQMETDLRHALERREFFIQYQPIVSLDDFRLRGFEALVRWRHPERGLVSPLDFIPVAEDTGQILAIGQWVLRVACQQMNQWQQQYGMEQPLFISVNLSSKQFAQPDLVEEVKSIISETRLNPRGLKLEITESMVMENVETATTMLHQLRDLGVQLSIDDFGTGYSSLSYLHRFPIDTLKIDRSFVIKMIDNTENIEIVRTIIMLAQNLGMDVIAEGVETKEQLALLRKLKCENGQGYYFAKPLETADAENLLSDVCTEGNPFKTAKQAKAEPIINTRVKSIKLAPVTDRL